MKINVKEMTFNGKDLIIESENNKLYVFNNVNFNLSSLKLTGCRPVGEYEIVYQQFGKQKIS